MTTMKLKQNKVRYVCRRCKVEQAVIVSIGRARHYSYNDLTGKHDKITYHPEPYKILYCPNCGSVDRRSPRQNFFVVRAYRPYSMRWRRNGWSRPTWKQVKRAVEQNTNIREAEAFEAKEAERASSTIDRDKESVSAEMCESFNEEIRLVI